MDSGVVILNLINLFVFIVFVLLSAAVVEVDEDVSWGHKKTLLK
jgi:hypothetical protein